MSNQAEYHVPTNRSDSADANGAHSTTPSVRHIPIFVEGRDEPLINRNHDLTSGHHQSTPLNQQHSSSSTTSTTTHSKRPTSGPSPNPFDWSRKFAQMGGLQSTTSTAAAAPPPQPHQHTSSTRNESPQRTIPVSHSAPPSVHHHTASATPRQHPYAQHTQSEGRATPDTPPQHQQQQSSAPSPSQHNAEPHQRPQPPKQQQQQPQQHAAEPQYAAPRSGAPDVAFTKITQIQVDVLELMDQVERFNGNSRKDRQYLYLDEMLTRNLLKLDTIDTEGRENLRQARREAIKCINKCIGVLEAKADSGAQQQEQEQQNKPKQQEQPHQASTTAENNRNQKRRSKRTK